MSLQKVMAKYLAIKNERKTMHLLLTPLLGSALYIGGGGVGLLLVIVIVVLLLR
jgi:cellobiose-specific phosphotransferase system component IIC